MRRISFELHSVPDVRYENDAFDDPAVLQSEFACDNLTHLVRIVQDLETRMDLDLQLETRKIRILPTLLSRNHEPLRSRS